MVRVRRRVTCLILAAGLIGGSQVTAQTEDDAAAQAAAEIIAARERANAAAAAYFEAQSLLDLLQLDQERLQIELAELGDHVLELEDAVKEVAVNRFVSSGTDGIPILTDVRSPSAQLQAGVFATIVTESGATSLDDYEEAREQLRLKRIEVEEHAADVRAQQAKLLTLQSEAEAEVARLREIESQRLENEAVAAALEARQREEARQLVELERRFAEAARTAAGAPATPVVVAPSGASSLGNTTGNVGRSGGQAGGRTGGGGSGTNPRLFGVGYVDLIICPIVGGSAYGDSWGAPRSGGRRHQGVDMLAPTGTPLQAVVSGTVTQGTNRLGGITLSLVGDNGNRYYYAHLVGYEGVSGPVVQGQVIGYVGDSGNAAGTPHLHFEIRPFGGVPVNPYPSVRAAGC